jgi:transcription elongation factor GreA
MIIKDKDKTKEMNFEETILTKEGYEKLKEELEYLKNDSREEIAERIKVAISFGDLSENSEYEDAKREQSYLEGKIAELEKKLLHVKIIEEELDSKKVKLGSKVKVQNLDTSDEVIFTIVGSMEFDPDNLKISNVSPVGKAILDKKVGATVKVRLPIGSIQYKIIEIMQ